MVTTETEALPADPSEVIAPATGGGAGATFAELEAMGDDAGGSEGNDAMIAAEALATAEADASGAPDAYACAARRAIPGTTRQNGKLRLPCVGPLVCDRRYTPFSVFDASAASRAEESIITFILSAPYSTLR